MDMDMDMDMDMHRIAHVTYMCIPAARASACALNLKSVKGKKYAGKAVCGPKRGVLGGGRVGCSLAAISQTTTHMHGHHEARTYYGAGWGELGRSRAYRMMDPEARCAS